MTDLLKTGSDWLEGRRSAHLTTAVEYTHRPGEQEATWTIPIDATVGRTEFAVETDHGVENWESRDFLVLAAELHNAGGEPVKPERGDRIVEMIGAAACTYEVMAPAAEPPWRYSDPYRKTLRIHTKLVDEA